MRLNVPAPRYGIDVQRELEPPREPVIGLTSLLLGTPGGPDGAPHAARQPTVNAAAMIRFSVPLMKAISCNPIMTRLPERSCTEGHSTGIHSTCSIRSAPEASIASRSNPSAIPDAAGMPCRSAARKSSSSAQSGP